MPGLSLPPPSSYSSISSSFFTPILNSKMAAAIQWNPPTTTGGFFAVSSVKEAGFSSSCPSCVLLLSQQRLRWFWHLDFLFIFLFFVRLWHVLRWDPFTNWTNSLTSHKQTCTPSHFERPQRCFLLFWLCCSFFFPVVDVFLSWTSMTDRCCSSSAFLFLLILLISFPLSSCYKLQCI